MGKISKASRVSKALVKKRITKPDCDSSPGISKLEQLSSLIASEPVSRGKRKRAVKLARLESRRAFVDAAIKSKRNAAHCDDLGQALGDFNEMAEAVSQELSPIPNVTPVTPKQKKPKWRTGALKRSERTRSDAIDIERFNTLMNIPEFASDPIAAMEKHLLNVRRKKEEKEQSKNRMELS